MAKDFRKQNAMYFTLTQIDFYSIRSWLSDDNFPIWIRKPNYNDNSCVPPMITNYNDCNDTMLIKMS